MIQSMRSGNLLGIIFREVWTADIFCQLGFVCQFVNFVYYYVKEYIKKLSIFQFQNNLTKI